MKRLIGSTRNLIKVGFLAAVVVVATLGFSQEPHAESAPNTQIVFSYSSAAPIPALAIIVTPGSIARDVYIWAIDVKEPTGVSGFNLAVQYDDSVLLVTDGGDVNGIGETAWLSSTGRGGGCGPTPVPESGIIIAHCFSLLPPPPFGPTGSGLIGHLTLTPGSELAASSQLTFVPPAVGVESTFLLNTPADPDDLQLIPLTLVNSNVVFLGCADNSPPPNGDGVIDLPNDILGVIVRYQMTSSHPDWDPAFDINDDGVIDLPNDILGTIQQYNLPCSRT